jgi:hypothetical protein
MLRRRFLTGLMAGSAVSLFAASGVARADDAGAPVGQGVWHGLVKASGANVRLSPSAGASTVAELRPGDPVDIDEWVAGSEVYPTLITWGHLADGRGYVYGSAIQPRPSQPVPAPPEDTSGWTGNWIDVNLTQNVIVAYEGKTVRGLFPVSPGRPGYETTRGKHQVRSQLPVDDMQGPGYYVRGVRWVSYFLPDGEAIHARTWDTDVISFGVPSSHGCLGVALEAAAFLYRFVSPGTPVYVHD